MPNPTCAATQHGMIPESKLACRHPAKELSFWERRLLQPQGFGYFETKHAVPSSLVLVYSCMRQKPRYHAVKPSYLVQ